MIKNEVLFFILGEKTTTLELTVKQGNIIYSSAFSCDVGVISIIDVKLSTTISTIRNGEISSELDKTSRLKKNACSKDVLLWEIQRGVNYKKNSKNSLQHIKCLKDSNGSLKVIYQCVQIKKGENSVKFSMLHLVYIYICIYS